MGKIMNIIMGQIMATLKDPNGSGWTRGTRRWFCRCDGAEREILDEVFKGYGYGS
jgi:hypothetical protein